MEVVQCASLDLISLPFTLPVEMTHCVFAAEVPVFEFPFGNYLFFRLLSGAFDEVLGATVRRTITARLKFRTLLIGCGLVVGVLKASPLVQFMIGLTFGDMNES